MNASGGGAQPSKKTQFQGPCYLKMLVNNLVAGSIIGKNGAVIASIEQQTGCTLKLSPSSSYFPGTQDRVVVMSGQQEQINNAMLIILDKVREVASQYAYDPNVTQQPSKLSCKVVVPKSAVSAIIGKGGQQVKQLQETTCARIQISSREEGLNERTVTISGAFEALQNAALTVAASIQTDQNLKDHMYVVYNKSGIGHGMPMGNPMGAQYGQFGAFAQYGGQAAHYGNVGPQADMLNQHCEIVMQVPDQYVGPVIGKNGLCLAEIIHATGARVQISQKGELIPGTHDRKVVISGGVGAVHNAHIMMLHRLETSQNQSKNMGNMQGANMAMQHGMNSHMQQQGMGMPQQHMQYPQQMQPAYGY